MIPKAHITAWRKNAPWREDWQVEQDLIIERALAEIFSDPFLKKKLAFRGGTALHKLFLRPQVRYSEDLDFVQVQAEPIKETINLLRSRLNFLGSPVIKQKANNNTLLFRFETEMEPRRSLKLKIEINCREHFTVFGTIEVPFVIESPWYSNETMVLTYCLEEILGTKLRALYQRKKGRDLFDIWYSLKHNSIQPSKIITAFNGYMEFGKNHISSKQFLRNMEIKISDTDFLSDIVDLLRPGIKFDAADAYEFVKSTLIEKL